MRKIKYIVLHCSATKEGVPFGICLLYTSDAADEL